MTDKISALQEKVKANPKQVFHRYSLAQAYFEENQLELACAEFEECLKARPDWMMAALFLGKAYLESEKKEKARENLELALSWKRAKSRRSRRRSFSTFKGVQPFRIAF